MSSFFLFLCALFTLTSFIHGKGTKPPANFRCNLPDKPKPMDVVIETGSKISAGTDDYIGLLLRDSHGVPCISHDLDNSGNDHERNSIDHYILCCSQDFAKANDTLSLLILHQTRNPRSVAGKDYFDNWFIERIHVHMKDLPLLNYRFHTWMNPRKNMMLGVSKVTDSRSNNGTPSYTLIHL